MEQKNLFSAPFYTQIETLQHIITHMLVLFNLSCFQLCIFTQYSNNRKQKGNVKKKPQQSQ